MKTELLNYEYVGFVRPPANPDEGQSVPRSSTCQIVYTNDLTPARGVMNGRDGWFKVLRARASVSPEHRSSTASAFIRFQC